MTCPSGGNLWHEQAAAEALSRFAHQTLAAAFEIARHAARPAVRAVDVSVALELAGRSMIPATVGEDCVLRAGCSEATSRAQATTRQERAVKRDALIYPTHTHAHATPSDDAAQDDAQDDEDDEVEDDQDQKPEDDGELGHEPEDFSQLDDTALFFIDRGASS